MLYITLRQYEYIVAVADAGSLTDAAAHLHVSQPSLSVAITRVEQRLGSLVFVRGKGTAIEITPFGHQVVAEARGLLGHATRLERKQDTQAPFVLACFEDIAPWYLAPALERLEAQFPALEVQVKEGRFCDLATDLAEGRTDVAMSYDVGFDGQFERRSIREVSPVAFLASDHPLATNVSLSFEELEDHPIILFDEDLSEGFIRNLFDEMRLQPKIKQRVRSLEMMRSLAANAAGVGISYSCPPGDISYDGKPVTTIPISTSQAAAEIVLVWSRLREMDHQFVEILDHLTETHSPE